MKKQINAYLDFLFNQKRYSKHTITAYRNDLIAFADYLEVFYEHQSVDGVSRRMISSFIADLAEGGMASRSINRKLSAIQSFFTHMVKGKLIDTNPAKQIQRPKVAQRLPSVMRSEQVKDLLDPSHFSKDFEGNRDLAILSVFYACGLRRDELINIRLADVNAASNQIKVLGKRNKERIIPVSPVLMQILEEYKTYRIGVSNGNDYLFLTSKGEKMYAGLVYKIVKNYLSNVTSLDKKSPHVLRHTFATHLLSEGANLQSIKELLGHESLATTQVYTHTSLEKLKDVYKNAHPRSKK
ncbi:MAG: tyrosine-type recombinase/integrase [Salibacteraceae bacterium]